MNAAFKVGSFGGDRYLATSITIVPQHIDQQRQPAGRAERHSTTTLNKGVLRRDVGVERGVGASVGPGLPCRYAAWLCRSCERSGSPHPGAGAGAGAGSPHL